jgi:hypothetical protein
MCTVTWLQTADGTYDLLCNRDERHERADAAPPTQQVRDGVRFLAPTDPDGGGTWIAVNEHGLSMCLLNGYAAEDDLLPSPTLTSRGLLVHELATAASVDDAVHRLGGRELDSFRSFRLLLLEPRELPQAVAWDRAHGSLSVDAPDLPLISCPVRTDEVHATRRAALELLVAEHGGLTVDALQEFHRSRHPDGWIWSVSMHHDVAATRSLSHVRVTRDQVAIAYTPGRPGDAAPGPVVSLERAQPA